MSIFQDQGEQQFFHGQRERMFTTDDQYVTQIDLHLQRLSDIFDWMDQDIVRSLRTQIIQIVKNNQQKLKTKYVTAACCFNIIKSTVGISQADCIKMLQSAFNIKQNKLFKYLRHIGKGGQELDKLQKQLPDYSDRLKKYFFGTGQPILLRLKQNNQTYLELVESILQRNKALISMLYDLEVVEQFCESKRPSRLVINMGFLVLQLQDIYILPGDYAKLFRISINSLRYFTQGLLRELYQFVSRLMSNNGDGMKISTQSQTYVDEMDEIKKEESFVSEIHTETEKLQMIKQFIDDYACYKLLLTDTSDEDQLIAELEALIKV